MSRWSPRLALLLALVASSAAIFGVASASAAQLVTNGDFETGTFEGWHTSSEYEDGEWFVYNRTEQEENGAELFPPASGDHAAADYFTSPDSEILYQEVALPSSSTDQLSMYFGYRSMEPISVPSPNTLKAEGIDGGNQQVRIDVLRAGAPIRSLEPGDILKTVYASEDGSPEELKPELLSADLSQFAGQTVMLRIANVVEDGLMNAFVDGVSIESNPVVTVAPPAPTPPSNVFTKGKLTLNKKSGTGTLAVWLPDAGVLTAVDARRQVAVASLAATKGKKRPVLIKTATVNSTGAGTVKVPIKPTPAGLKILKEKGKLSFKLQLTFAPTGGTPSTMSFGGKLMKTLKPARR